MVKILKKEKFKSKIKCYYKNPNLDFIHKFTQAYERRDT